MVSNLPHFIDFTGTNTIFLNLQLDLRAGPTLLPTLFPWWKNIGRKLPFILALPHVMQEAVLRSGLETQKKVLPANLLPKAAAGTG